METDGLELVQDIRQGEPSFVGIEAILFDALQIAREIKMKIKTKQAMNSLILLSETIVIMMFSTHLQPG